MTIRIRNTSRLKHSVLLSFEGLEFWELPEYPTIEAREDDIYHETDSLDRLDRIAVRYYGDPNLWWVIAIANGKRNLPYEMETGEILRVPAPTYVFSELLKSRRR